MFRVPQLIIASLAIHIFKWYIAILLSIDFCMFDIGSAVNKPAFISGNHSVKSFMGFDNGSMVVFEVKKAYPFGDP